MKLVIVGGVAGGASAAARARRLDESAEIVLFERGPDVSFANCGLPYYVGETIAERDKLLVVTPARLRERFRLDVRINSSVERIDRGTKQVFILEVLTGRTYSESYDKLILAPGASPILPALPGADLPNVYTLRTLGDADRIKGAVDKASRALIVGAGFIGLELAENFVQRGLTTTVLQLDSQILSPFDTEMTTPIVEKLSASGVRLAFRTTVERIERTGNELAVTLTSGEVINVDLVVFGIGVRPDNHLAADAGLEIGPRGGIRVNEHLQTSDLDIYAAGDAVETVDATTGQRIQVPLAGPANRQGRIAASHALGHAGAFRGTQGTAIIGLFGLTAALTGLSEKTLRKLGRPYRKVYIHPAHHASYYPGAEAMTLKILFEPDSGKILGAQGVGGAGVDKRIDVLAVAIQAGMSVFDLEEAELSYAPQFGSAKDPINMLGFVASGVLRGEHPQIHVQDLTEDLFVLDVRTPAEHFKGSIRGAINIPVDNLRERLDEIPEGRKVAVYCQVGQRGYLATRVLLHAGMDAANVSGGYRTFLLHNPE